MEPIVLIILTLTIAAVFYGYVYFIYKRYGVLPSISTSSYKLKGQQRWLFFAFLTVIGLLNLPQLGIWSFLSSAGLMFSGITIDHRSKAANTKQVHFVGTVGAILFAYFGLFLLYGMVWPIAVFAVSCLFIWRFAGRKFIWYAEIAAMTIALIAYMLRFV